MDIKWFRKSFSQGFLIALITVAVLVAGPDLSPAKDDLSHQPGVTYQIKDNWGRVVSLTCHQPAQGDEIIGADGRHYQVMTVHSEGARVKSLGKNKDFLAMVDYYHHPDVLPVATPPWHQRPVGIYHTHSDESYVPSDGVSSIPFRGGIYQVGATFEENLKQNKVEVLYDETPHDPHDSNAYYRSRRTAVELLKQNPVALFDVHRDGIDDPEFYGQIIEQKGATQLRLVVGRQNPKMATNLDFAKRLMAYANNKHPQLVKEIYLAKGNYNQDLLSTALLIEAGTYTNNKPQAESGVALLAAAVPGLMGLAPPPQSATGQTDGKAAGKVGWKTAVFLVMFTVLGVAGFILLNNPWSKVSAYWQDQAARLRRKK